MIKKIFIIIIVVILILVSDYFFMINNSVNKNNQEVKFIITKGEGVKQISKNLDQANLIRSNVFFDFYVWLKGSQTNFKAGEYVLRQNMNLKEIISELTGNKALSKEKIIKIIEGWDINDINNYLNKNSFFVDNNFNSLAKTKISKGQFKTPKPDFLNKAPESADLEGFLFPDTYRLFQDATTEDLIIKMLNNFDKKLTTQMRQDIVQQNKTIYQIVTMASIIEREVRTVDDMQTVSGLFWNRIKNGQALQSCATLAYILGEKKTQYSLEDTKVDSLYNTYQNQGLPPGPIANPGLNAIKAAIYPKYTDYNYFLSRPDTGETIFSKSYEEHNRNKAKYLK
ncbi:endolytic transglycosylase MltG [Patescibacteria group bacterium]|nr:endolytic transglycosylase MltG [Patescibacteria group bacterium]MBU1062975.1 endolytic transglycosylase MltG [Patescibacteria group bacterium]